MRDACEHIEYVIKKGSEALSSRCAGRLALGKRLSEGITVRRNRHHERTRKSRWTDTYGSVILGDSGAKKMDSQNQHEDRTPITVGFVGIPIAARPRCLTPLQALSFKVLTGPVLR